MPPGGKPGMPGGGIPGSPGKGGGTPPWTACPGGGKGGNWPGGKGRPPGGMGGMLLGPGGKGGMGPPRPPGGAGREKRVSMRRLLRLGEGGRTRKTLGELAWGSAWHAGEWRWCTW